MKLTAKTDLEVPAAAVFATLVDHPFWERDAVRNGAEVER
ncbi:MAG: SRPBCC family protein, partial [Rhodobacter sp.]|nr:SRPBCC family protein [Rhodobacter sp.]